MSQPQPPDPEAFVTETGKVWVARAAEARKFEMPSRLDSPRVFAQAVIEVRAKLDLLEELLSSAQALAGEYRRKAVQFEQRADEDWDREMDGLPPGHRLQQEYTGARERYAHVNLLTLAQRREANQWKRAADLAGDLAARIEKMYWGLNGVRLDIHKLLSYFPLEQSLERGA